MKLIRALLIEFFFQAWFYSPAFRNPKVETAERRRRRLIAEDDGVRYPDEDPTAQGA